jgi:hypothetical protein
MIEPGEQAPDFELPDQDARPVKLSAVECGQNPAQILLGPTAQEDEKRLLGTLGRALAHSTSRTT